ncbi:MAG: ATP-binding cassette domain-containing protein [Planctomycetota bacterium]
MPDDPLIARLVGVHKRFAGGPPVLAGVDLDFRRGETTVVLGPSGAGKSVTLKHIVGLVKPDAGEVYFDGTRIDTLSERRLNRVRTRLGFLFQLGALFDSMTVAENLAFPLREHTDARAGERSARVEEALALVDMAGAGPKMPAELSGGQQKRIALARAIILRPTLILYDEPTTGLDPARADGINDLIIKLQRELEVSSIVVTHDLASATRVGDRVVVLLDGLVAADGSMDEIRASTNPAVRGFLAGRYGDQDAAMAAATEDRDGRET